MGILTGDAMAVGLEIPGIAAAEQNLLGIAAAFDAIATAQRAVGASSPKAAGGGNAVGSGGGGPMARLARAQQALQAAQTPDDLFDAQLAVHRAQRAVQRGQSDLGGAPESTFGSRFLKALGTSRFGMGDLMPLVGRSMEVLFPGAHKAMVGGNMAGLQAALGAFGPFAAALVGAVAPLYALKKAADMAAEELRAMRSAQTLSGGSPAEIAALKSMGIRPGQIPGMAAGLRERLGSDPYAMGILGHVPQRQFGPANEAKILFEALTYLRSLGEGEEQLRQARILGLDATLDSVNVSREQWEQLRITNAVQQQLTRDGHALKSSRELASAQANLSGAMSNLKQALGKDALPMLTRAINGIALMINALSLAWEKMPREAKMLFYGLGGAAVGVGAGAAMGNPAAGGIAGAVAGLVAGYFATDPARRMETAANRFSDAVGQFAGALRSPGFYGGGPRARAAIPRGWSGAQFNELADARALAAGAFGLA